MTTARIRGHVTAAAVACLLSASILVTPASAAGEAGSAGGFAASAQAADLLSTAQRGESASCTTGSASDQTAAATATPAGFKQEDASLLYCRPSGPNWVYEAEYFWGAQCHAAGLVGLQYGLWREHRCTCGSSITNYELWVR